MLRRCRGSRATGRHGRPRRLERRSSARDPAQAGAAAGTGEARGVRSLLRAQRRPRSPPPGRRPRQGSCADWSRAGGSAGRRRPRRAPGWLRAPAIGARRGHTPAAASRGRHRHRPRARGSRTPRGGGEGRTLDGRGGGSAALLCGGYLRGMKRDECVAPMPGRPCFTGL